MLETAINNLYKHEMNQRDKKSTLDKLISTNKLCELNCVLHSPKRHSAGLMGPTNKLYDPK